MRQHISSNFLLMGLLAVFAALALTACGAKPPAATADSAKGKEGAMKISSPVFKEGEAIPQKYSCKGENISPALNWSDIPAGTKSFALVTDDPDAPIGTFVHWVIFNIPAGAKGLPEAVPPETRKRLALLLEHHPG